MYPKNSILTNDMSSGGCIILDEADVVAIIATGLLWSLDLNKKIVVLSPFIKEMVRNGVLYNNR